MDRPAAVASVIVALVVVTACIGYFVTMTDHRGDGAVTTSVVGVGEFNSVELGVTSKDLKELGYSIGDKILVSANGKEYNATYVYICAGVGTLDSFINTNDPLDDNNVTFAIFNADVWTCSGCEIGDVIELKKNGRDPNIPVLEKYLRGQVDDRSLFTDEEYSNFRAVVSAGMKEGILFRSVSPFTAGYERSEVAADFYERNGIENIVSIGDVPAHVERCRNLYGDDYYPVKLYDTGKAFVKNIDPVFTRSPLDFREVLLTISEMEGSVAVNCQLGKDRTGLTVSILLALTGASYEEIRSEYLLTYVNLYGVEVGSEEYDVLGRMMFDRALYVMDNPDATEQAGLIDWNVLEGYDFDVGRIVLKFLKESAMMTDAEIDKVIDKIAA